MKKLWTIKIDEHGDYNILDHNGSAIAVCVQNAGRPPTETLEAANLISAAPDMLEALIALMPVNTGYMESMCWADYNKAVDKAETVIAKARGKT